MGLLNQMRTDWADRQTAETFNRRLFVYKGGLGADQQRSFVQNIKQHILEEETRPCIERFSVFFH
jgi:hypothetical protein